jgi:uncharacterized secreted protein with C-terminal beta-propeller domain
MAMWKYMINPYSVASSSRQNILYHSIHLEQSIQMYIKAVEAIEKDINPNKIVEQIELLYKLRDLKEKITQVKEELKVKHIDASYR